MPSNLSKLDRILRFFGGSLIWGLYLTGYIERAFSHFGAIIGVILLTTSIINFCPYYMIVGFSTNQNNHC